MNVARLIIDPAATGSWNMAVDEALLQTTKGAQRPTLRVYSWSQPTLSLGYFQPQAARGSHLASESCPLVRRSTGGGAILHDRELTYSMTIPLARSAAHTNGHWYHVIHGSLIAALAEFGVVTRICQQTETQRTGAFLCFQRRTRGDVLLQGAKIAGSAQRRSRDGLLQHGSVLLDRSRAAPELPGIQQLNSLAPSAHKLLNGWLQLLASRLDLRWNRGQLTQEEEELSHSIELNKFNEKKWTLRR